MSYTKLRELGRLVSYKEISSGYFIELYLINPNEYWEAHFMPGSGPLPSTLIKK